MASQPSPSELRRDGSIFFVGGILPVFETLETMFDSHCMSATELFYLTFGTSAMFRHGEEMARQIKKNFTVRLMVRVGHPINQTMLERLYAAGVDAIDIPLQLAAAEPASPAASLRQTMRLATAVFPRWATAASLLVDPAHPDTGRDTIDSLLAEGIVPHLAFSGCRLPSPTEGPEGILTYLLDRWRQQQIPAIPYLPLLALSTTIGTSKPGGFFRRVLARIREQHHLANSQLVRHLRVQQAEDSLDSAGL